MKSIILKLTVPDEVEPFDILNNMIDDFFNSDSNFEDFGPHMENITLEVVREDK